MIRLLDRYMLKELVLPFALTLLGFLIFFVLFLVGNLSQYLVDRILPAGTIALLLLYRLPYLLMLALPVATLFAIFLALGRQGHDRELIALQAVGISLRRMIVPLLAVGLFVSGADLLISDQLAPWGNQRFLSLWVRSVYGARQTPHIEDNAFFKGVENRFFYVRHFDRDENVLEDVLIYDLTGEWALQDGRMFPKVVSAKRATWSGDTWRLQDGFVHAYDDQGSLRYTSRFETMEIRIQRALRELALSQRTPQEMGLRELGERIQAFQAVGRSANALIVEYHAKLAIPVASLVFALFGAPLSLLIGPRGRAIGVIASVLLVLAYQGVYFWTATILGNRGDIPPAWGAWLPNVVFGLVGLALTWNADRLGRIDILERSKRVLPALMLFALFAAMALAVPAWGTEERSADQARTGGRESLPLTLTAETVTFTGISESWEELRAQGDVRARFEGGETTARSLRLVRREGSRWTLSARGARFHVGEISGGALSLSGRLAGGEAGVRAEEIQLSQSASVEFHQSTLSAERITLSRGDGGSWQVEAFDDVVFKQVPASRVTKAEALQLRLSSPPDTEEPGRWHAEAASVRDFSGETDFVNARGERHRLRYQGDSAKITFQKDNKVALIEVEQGDFTTCTCQAQVPDAAYSIRAGRLLIRPDDLLAAFDITLRAFGTSVFWAPAYVSPLGDIQQKYPFLPQVGRSTGRGWFARWRIPFFLDEETHGHVLLDYFNRHGEVGTGIDLNYLMVPGSLGGRLSFYRLVGPEEAFSLDWSERLRLEDRTSLDLSAQMRTGQLAQETTQLRTGASLSGQEGEWDWQLSFRREQNLLGEDPDPETLETLKYRVLERFPELELNRSGFDGGPLPVQLSLGGGWGRYREVALDGTARASSRLDGRIGLKMKTISPFEGSKLGADSGYRVSLYDLGRRESWDLHPRLDLEPLKDLDLAVDHLYRALHGRSPFRFDELAVSNRTKLRGTWAVERGIDFQADGAYDWTRDRFLPLHVNTNWQRGFVGGALGLEVDLNRWALSRATGRATIGQRDSTGWRLAVESGYRFEQGRFEDLIAKIDVGRPFRAGLRFDANQLALRRVNLQSRWDVNSWGLRFGVEYDVGSRRFTALQADLVRKFCHACWEIGVRAGLNELSVQARINAFPTAEVRYSPTDQELSFGS